MLQQYLTRENILFIPVFLIVISALVAAHEYGHYLFARLFGMGVEEFAIGFGRKPLWVYKIKEYFIPVGKDEIAKDHFESSATDGFGFESKDRKVITSEVVETENGPAVREKTKFTIRPWPLGGFVRIKGMIPEDDGSETKIPGGFYSKEPWKRFIVLLAGPVFSIIAGAVLIFIVFATFGARTTKVPLVGQVSLESPALAAGLKEGDRIVSIDNEPVTNTFDVVKRVRFAGERPHALGYIRDGKQFNTSITPITLPGETEVMGPDYGPTGQKARQAFIGVRWAATYERMPIGQAAAEAATAPAKAFVFMGELIKTPSKLKENVGGPITMLKETHAAVKNPPDILALAAMLSISVGIFNLLPIPPLDGGQMAIAFAEMLRRGKRLSMKVQNMAAAAGMLMVLLMVVGVFTIDIQRLGQSNQTKFSDMVKQSAEKPSANPTADPK